MRRLPGSPREGGTNGRASRGHLLEEPGLLDESRGAATALFPVTLMQRASNGPIAPWDAPV
jgi:hypothetical protein